MAHDGIRRLRPCLPCYQCLKMLHLCRFRRQDRQFMYDTSSPTFHLTALKGFRTCVICALSDELRGFTNLFRILSWVDDDSDADDLPGEADYDTRIFCALCGMARQLWDYVCSTGKEESKAFRLGKMCINCWERKSKSWKKRLEPLPPIVEVSTSQPLSFRWKPPRPDVPPSGKLTCLSKDGRENGEQG
jgi:hypothetical protein